MTQNSCRKEKKVINFKSCFDVIGPIMIGPSSSHTAGAISIGLVANKLFQKKPKRAIIKYYESFADTHKGHGTDYAIVSGILGFATDDSRVPNALEIAKEEGIDVTFIEMEGNSPVHHANTACVNLQDDESEIHMTGISVGGGTIEVKYIEIDGFTIHPQGTLPILLAITDNQDLKPLIEETLQNHHIKVNTITRYQNDEQYLFQFDLDARPSKRVEEELLNLSQDAKIILL